MISSSYSDEGSSSNSELEDEPMNEKAVFYAVGGEGKLPPLYK